MRVLLIDIDSKMGNLALMKISAYHKKRGDVVYLNRGCLAPDRVYISCIFTRNRPKALGLAKLFPNSEVQVGGSGVGFESTLPDEIEHMRPDYELYGVDYAMGFTSRGCIRNCPWCIVPKKEGPIRDHAPLNEFWDPRFRKVILLDNNFLASPNWYENLSKIIFWRLMVNFSQGLDIRLIDRENAGLLRMTRFYNWHFTDRVLHFAFDLPDMEPEVREGIAVLKKAGIKPRELMFYMLCGYNTSFEEDMHRFRVLRELGVDPFVMKYNNRRDVPILNAFARWVNKRLYKVCEFEKYKRLPKEVVKRE